MFNTQQKIIVKYIGFLIVIGILPLFALGFVSYQTSSHTLQQAEKSFSQALLKDQKDLLQLQLAEVENLIANISGVEEITQALDDKEREANTYTNLATQARIGYILNGYLHLQGLVSIDIFTEGGAHYHVGDTLNVDDIRRSTVDQLRTEAMINDHKIYWAGVVPNVNKNSNHQFVLAAARILSTTDRQTLKQHPIALILVNYSLDYLYDHFSNTGLGVNAAINLIDQHKNIIYTTDKNRLGQPANGILAEVLKQANIPQTITWDDKDFIIQAQSIQNLGWTLLSIIPEQALLSGANTIRKTTLILLFTGLLIVGIAAWLFSKNVVQPIRNIINGYKRLQNNPLDLEHHLPIHSTDEIGELVQGFNSFLDNLSAQQVIEAARQESEERYALVMNATHEGIWDWNLITDEIYFSPRFSTLLGLDNTAENITNKPEEWFNRVHPDDLIILEEEISSHLAGESIYFQCEHRLLHHDGTYHWVLSHGLAVRDETGQAIRMAGSHTDISDRKEAENQLVHRAFHDELTGLNNRAWFVSYLQKKLARVQRDTETIFAVLFLDLDKFKMVNDTLGHAFGDALLIQVSERLKKCLRETDLLARLGGDEFVILLEQNDNYHSIQVAERILISLAAPFLINGQEIQSGVSIGITLSSSGYTDSDEMLRDADIAMYQAKMSGNNRYVVFDEAMRSHLLNRLSMEKELAAALKNGELELYYQPIVSLQTGLITGFEALARWNHTVLGMVSPAKFIPIAESSNLIYSIGQWVLETACQQWQAWSKQYSGMRKLQLSLNLSALQFHDEGFLEKIPETLSTYGISGSELAFEITETAIIQDTQHASHIIAQLKKLGINIHLDDFGTGYSSLSHLAGFSIDLIKIDRSFVNQCTSQEKQFRMVRGLINLTHDLGLQCTAEGIEEENQWDILNREECDFGQGFWISKPLPAGELAAFMSTHIS